jgi:hypothetical protein
MVGFVRLALGVKYVILFIVQGAGEKNEWVFHHSEAIQTNIYDFVVDTYKTCYSMHC